MAASVRFVRCVVVAVILTVWLLPAPVSAATVEVGRHTAIEQRIGELVNDARRARGLKPYLMHAGLRDVAREHSVGMSKSGRLSHDGFVARLHRATPDPQQVNRGSDEGFFRSGLAACENAAYRFRAGTTDETDEQVAQGFFGQWWRSAPHRDCLLDVWRAGLNATGIGLYRDAQGVWWATMEVAHDQTPPASGAVRCGVDAVVASANACV